MYSSVTLVCDNSQNEVTFPYNHTWEHRVRHVYRMTPHSRSGSLQSFASTRNHFAINDDSVRWEGALNSAHCTNPLMHRTWYRFLHVCRNCGKGLVTYKLTRLICFVTSVQSNAIAQAQLIWIHFRKFSNLKSWLRSSGPFIATTTNALFFRRRFSHNSGKVAS
jgi:hypothetical protein